MKLDKKLLGSSLALAFISLGIFFYFKQKNNCYWFKEYLVCPDKPFGYKVYYGNRFLVELYYPPEQVLNISTIKINVEALKGKTIYIIFPPDKKGNFAKVSADLYYKISQIAAMEGIPFDNIKKACLYKYNNCTNYFPVISNPHCNSTKEVYFIIYPSNITTVKGVGKSCIYIEGNENTITKSYSYFMYSLLGII